MKRIALLFLLLLIVLTACACQGNPDDFFNQVASDIDQLTVEDKALSIALLTSFTTVDENSYHAACYREIKVFMALRSDVDTLDTYCAQDDTAATCQALLSKAASEHNVVVAMGYAFSVVGAISSNYPNTRFILIDAYPTDSVGNVVTASNVYAATFRAAESGFLAGLAAALESKTGYVATVLGMPNNANIDYYLGFNSGVSFANRYYGVSATVIELEDYAEPDSAGNMVKANFVGSYGDPETAQTIARRLIQRGVDVILCAAGGSNDGVYTLAAENKIKVIGVDADMYDQGAYEGGNTVLTSVYKDLGGVARTQLNAIVQGTFTSGNVELGADTGATGYISETGRQQLSDSTIAVLEENYQLLSDGVIIPASTANGYRSDSFPGM